MRPLEQIDDLLMGDRFTRQRTFAFRLEAAAPVIGAEGIGMSIGPHFLPAIGNTDDYFFTQKVISQKEVPAEA